MVYRAAKQKLKLIGFGDNISHEKVDRFKFSHGGFEQRFGNLDNISPSRTRFFYLVLLTAAFIFLARIFSLAIINGAKNRALADSNRIRLVNIEAPRGKIFDRNGKLLADSQTAHFLQKGDSTAEISAQQALELEQNGLASENFEGELGIISSGVKRQYPLGEAAAHVLGYTSIIQKEDLAARSYLPISELVGRLGVEASYDDFLRGKPGRKLIEIDAAGKNISILGKEEPLPGRNIRLTIDSDLQKVAYEALNKNAQKFAHGQGAFIVSNVNTGEILALASAPSFNGEDIGKFVTDEKKPLFNRAVLGIYPPGSVFKIVSALAGLESGKINKDTEIEDVGEFYLGDVRFANWFYLGYGQKDGVLKLDKALARSNDIFFYRLAENIGLDALRQTAIKLGFGQKTGIDLPDESLGLVPDGIWKESVHNLPWYPGDTLHFAIGQGFALATPIQVNMLTGFAAGGKLNKPYLVSKIEGGVKEINLNGKIIGENLIARENLEIVRMGMKMACGKGGTGWPFFNAPYKVGCKTGTAEKELGNPHAWFTAFAPFDNPQIAITVIIEDGGEGSSVAAPTAKEVLDWWLDRNIKN